MTPTDGDFTLRFLWRRVRLRWLSSVSTNWRAELLAAADDEDWASVCYCLKQDSHLLNRQWLHGLEALASLIVHDAPTPYVQEAVATGERLETFRGPPPGFSTPNPPRSYEWISGLDADLRFNVLVLARFFASASTRDFLWRTASRALKYEACLFAIGHADAEWMATLPLAQVFASVAQDFTPFKIEPHWHEDHIRRYEENPALRKDTFHHRLSPLCAALIGDQPLSVFESLWDSCPEKLRNLSMTVLSGYGHDNDPVYSGALRYWAERLGRADVAEFLKTKGL